MEIEPIGATQESAVWFSATERAQELAVARQTERLQGQGLQVSHEAANVTTSTRFSPALYAQAAQFQLYTQSGTLAAMLVQHGQAPQQPTHFHEHPNEIKAVEGTEGTSVDTFI